jgi:hypothetical protein
MQAAQKRLIEPSIFAGLGEFGVDETNYPLPASDLTCGNSV